MVKLSTFRYSDTVITTQIICDVYIVESGV